MSNFAGDASERKSKTLPCKYISSLTVAFKLPEFPAPTPCSCIGGCDARGVAPSFGTTIFAHHTDICLLEKVQYHQRHQERLE